MATSQAQLEYDAQGKPLGQVEYDAEGKPLTGEAPKEPDVITALPPLHVTPKIAGDMWKAGVHSKMLGVTPGMAYENRDEIDKQLRERGGDYDGELDDTIANDIKVGLEGSIFGLHHREKMPEKIHDPGMVDKFVSGLAEMVADLPFYAVGGLAGGAAGSEVPAVGTAIGAAAGAFAVPSAVREALVLGIKNGEVKDFKDLLHRAADVTWEATKGAAVGTATELAGGLPVGGLIAKSGGATIAMKGLYQATALTTAADLLEGKLPSASDFASNAALIVPLNLVTHGMAMTHGDAKTALQDVFVKDGKTAKETKDILSAQPPAKPDLPEGLRPAIKFGEDAHLEGDVTETHTDLVARTLGTKPVVIDELEANPELVDKVLQNPKVHEQSVIDEAYRLKKEAIESGASDDELPPRNQTKSGRGFVTPDGKFLTREQALSWMKENEPEVYEMWTKAGQKELHSIDYKEARDRVSGMNLAEGSEPFDSMSNDLNVFWAGGRSVLNGIKAGLKGSEYGESAIRTLLVGPHNAFVAEAAQVVGRLRKMVPDVVDQRAISFMRDYRDNPQNLRTAIDQIKAGQNERLKAYIPSMERALKPTPEMLRADIQLTNYFRNALNRARQLGIMTSTIDPARYSPRMFVRQMGDAKGFGGRRLTEKTPHAIQREYLHLLDPLKSGEFEARTFNAFDELAIYGDRHATAVSTKLFTTELRNSSLGVEGTRENHPEGWKLLSGSDGLYVPEKIADAIEPMLARGGELSAVAKFLHVQQLTKAIELGLSFFHIKAMGITALNNMGVDGYLRTMHSDNSSPAFEAQERHHALYGLTTTKTGPEYEAYKGGHPSDIPTGFDKFTNLPLIKQVDSFAKSITKATFDVVQRKFKVADMSAKEAAWVAKHPEATEQEYASAMRSIAKEVNAAYGGLNWDVMGVSKGMRDMYRMFLLAPDWTFSNIINAKYAFQGGPAGIAARMFFVKSFTTGFAMTAAMSIAIGGKYDPSDLQNLDRVYLGIDKDGKKMYVNLFFAGAPKDLMTWVKKSISDTPIAGTAEFVVNKAAPVIGSIGHLAMNVEYGGKPIYKKTDTTAKQLADQGKYVAERVAPISLVSAVETIMRALKDPAQLSYKDLLELAGDAMGSQVVRESPKAQSNAGGRALQFPGGAGKKNTWTSPLGKQHAGRSKP